MIVCVVENIYILSRTQYNALSAWGIEVMGISYLKEIYICCVDLGHSGNQAWNLYQNWASMFDRYFDKLLALF